MWEREKRKEPLKMREFQRLEMNNLDKNVLFHFSSVSSSASTFTLNAAQSYAASHSSLLQLFVASVSDYVLEKFNIIFTKNNKS